MLLPRFKLDAILKHHIKKFIILHDHLWYWLVYYSNQEQLIKSQRAVTV